MTTTRSSTEDAQTFRLTPPWSTIEDDNLTRIVEVSLDKGFNNNWSVIAEDLHVKVSATLRSGKQCRERWLQLLNLRMQLDTEGASSSSSNSNIIGSGRHDHADRNGNKSGSLPSPRPTAKDSSGLRDRAPTCSSAVFGTQGSWGSCLGPLAKSNQSIQTSLTSMSSNRTGRAQSPHTHWGPRSPASTSLTTGSTPSVVSVASSPTKEAPAPPAAAKTGQQQCKVSDERLLGKQPVPGTLPKIGGTPSNSPGLVVVKAVDGPRRPLSASTSIPSPSGFYAKDHAAYSQRMIASNTSHDVFLPPLASGSPDVTVPPEIRAASMASRPATAVHHVATPQIDSSTAVAMTTADTAALYDGGIGSMMRPPSMTSMPHTAAHPYQHHHHHHQQYYQPPQQYPQQQQQYYQQHQYQQQYQQRCAAGMGAPRIATGCVGGYPMAIPGTSVRRFMHTQLLLSLMSAPGLSVVTTAKASWDRLGYYPVDAVFGPPAPGSSPGFPRDLQQSFPPSLPPDPAPAPHSDSLQVKEDIEPPPPKRRRLVKESESGGADGDRDGNGGKGGELHHGPDIKISSNTGAMAMPPAQHSPRTSAILSGLLRTDSAIMLGESEDIAYSAPLGLEGVEPLSPSYFPEQLVIPEGHSSRRDGAGEEGGIEDGREGERENGAGAAGQRVGDDGQFFDLTAAFGGGSHGMIDTLLVDFEPACFSKLVSPGFGARRLSPLAGSLSPQSLSPLNWTSPF